MKHLLGIEALTAGEITALVDHALELKAGRSRGVIASDLQGETWAMRKTAFISTYRLRVRGPIERSLLERC